MIPYNTRLWGVHPSEITAAWCSRFVPLPEARGRDRRRRGPERSRARLQRRASSTRASASASSAKGLAARGGRRSSSVARPTAIDWQRRELRLRGRGGPLRRADLVGAAARADRALADAPGAGRRRGAAAALHAPLLPRRRARRRPASSRCTGSTCPRRSTRSTAWAATRTSPPRWRRPARPACTSSSPTAARPTSRDSCPGSPARPPSVTPSACTSPGNPVSLKSVLPDRRDTAPGLTCANAIRTVTPPLTCPDSATGAPTRTPLPDHHRPFKAAGSNPVGGTAPWRASGVGCYTMWKVTLSASAAARRFGPTSLCDTAITRLSRWAAASASAMAADRGRPSLR